jgi:hypothetical protein
MPAVFKIEATDEVLKLPAIGLSEVEAKVARFLELTPVMPSTSSLYPWMLPCLTDNQANRRKAAIEQAIAQAESTVHAE